MKVAESIHAQYQPLPQLDTQDDIGEAEEDRDGQDLEQAEEPSAVQDEEISAEVDQGRDAGAEHGQEEPPIEIKAIPQPDSSPPAPEFTETTQQEPEQPSP